MDGRDTALDSGIGHIKSLEAKMAELGVGKIATVMGRYYAMDRDNRWDRVERAYDAMTTGAGNHAASALQVMEETYAAKITDEFVLPTIIDTAEDKAIKSNDTIIFLISAPTGPEN